MENIRCTSRVNEQMQPRTVINKFTGKYRTTNEIPESTGQLQKYRNLQDLQDHWDDTERPALYSAWFK